MNTAKFFLASFLFLFIINSASFATVFRKGENYSGFRLIDKRFVKEVNAECFYFEHIKSEAHLFKIASNDINKTFSIAFKTDPESDYGTPHIIEHSVLNGSKNFPVKSPFDILSKGSLNTYLNALTSANMTQFPVASMNEKDYFNLMHVYLDAVFNPLFYTDSKIFKQEGWHYEMDKIDGPITYKGVVYNEMKGAYSDPTRELNYLTNKFLFPDNGYKYTSGGYPALIPKLTQKMFIEFHKKYYHPSNSYILLYGNADLAKELEFIDKEYLSNYRKETVPQSFPIQKPFNAMKEIETSYSAAEGSNTENQTFLSLSFVVGLNSNRALLMELNTLADVLVNQESGIIRLALQKAGIGKDVRCYVDAKRQNVFTITVQNANAKDKDKFREIVLRSLKEISESGLDKKSTEGSINQTEFYLREGNTSQRGLYYASRVFPGWLFADDPFMGLEYEKPLTELKAGLSKNHLESIIKNEILGNKHALLLILEPKPGLEKELNTKVEKELQEYKASLSDAEKESLINETKELREYQKREDTPEAVATMPLLERKDINPKSEWYQAQEKNIAGVPVVHYEDFCNNIIYSGLMFDTRVLPTELVQYSQLLSDILIDQNTQNYSYGDLEKAININTGGIYTFLNTFLEKRNDDNVIPKLFISSRALNSKTGKMLELVSEIINKTRYSDLERMKTILSKAQALAESQVKRNGIAYAQFRNMSYFSKSGMLSELTKGFEYYWFLTDLVTNYNKKSLEISDNLAKTASLIFNKKNLIATVTCSKEDYPAYSQNLEKLIVSLPDNPVELQNWTFNFEKKNEGFLSASKVQYVIKGYDLKKLGYAWNGKINVLSQIISTDWLQNQVRVLGGAYGGFCNFSNSGVALFSSYRDPNLKETLSIYDAIPDYLDKVEIDEKAMTRYIIGTIAAIDKPLTPSGKGELAVKYYVEKTNPEDIQAERDAILSVTLKDIKSMKQMVADMLNQKAFCVYGNEDKIKSQKEIFGSLKNISR